MQTDAQYEGYSYSIAQPTLNMQKEIEELSFYSFFTQYSLMNTYGFSAGVLSRLFKKILPDVPDNGTIEYFLLQEEDAVNRTIALLNFTTIADSKIAAELDLSIKALCSKIMAFGLDNKIRDKFHYLEIEVAAFNVLFEKLHDLDKFQPETSKNLLRVLEEIETLILTLRQEMHRIGTNLHLTVVTKRILEYIFRVKELLNLKLNIRSKSHWEHILKEHIEFSKQKNSVRLFITRHSDLLALEIVEHTSTKGEKYIAETKRAYWNFFLKSLLGGGIIALFALAKIMIDSFSLSQGQNALFFSINYALCFILVKQFGGIIATKQPAMTASTIAENIDRNGDLAIGSIQAIILLVRKVFRSQFISLIGNFLMALTFACLIAKLLEIANFQNVTNAIQPSYLLKNVKPNLQLVFFAAIAGVFLALSGLISGYFDNKVVASKIGHRIKNSQLFFKSERFSKYIEKKLGSLIGNIALGLLLGSTFLLSGLVGFPLDIRHIAFSAANVGYAAMNDVFSYQTILLALAGVLLIGFINFIVSFSITLFLAMKSRGATASILPALIFNVLKDFVQRPLGYFIFSDDAK